MFNILTMSRFYLPYQSNVGKAIARIWLAFLALFYLLVLFSEAGASWSFYAGIYFGAGSVSLMFAGLLWSRKILQAATWFHAASTPHKLWRAWLRGLVQRAWLYLIVFSVSMNLLEATHHAISNWSAVWAISALCLSGTFLLGLLFAGHAPRALILTLIGGLIWYCVATDITTTSNWAQQLWYTHLPFFLIWICISFTFIFLWASPPAPRQSHTWIPASSNSGVLLRVKNQLLFYRRYTSLDTQHKQAMDSRSINYSNRFLHFTALFWFSGTIPSMTTGWGGKVSLKHLLFLGISTAVVSTYLVGKDLHWRFLLIPKGLRQGRIGNHILLSTLSYYAKFLFIILGIAVLTYLGFTGTLPAPANWISDKAAIFLIELIMCLCIAIAVRGSQHPRRVFFYLFNFGLLASALYGLFAFFQQKNPLTAPITTMNVPYLISVILIALCALVWANKLWTQERLLPYLKRT